MSNNKILRFLSEYADAKLFDAEEEENSIKSKEKYLEYEGMRELINALIDELR